MSSSQNEWPAFFPTYVPPTDAEPTVGVSYRLVENNPPSRSDFQSTVEEFPRRSFKSRDQEICACGTSQFRELKDIQKKRKLFPKLRNKMIAQGQLEPSLGKMMNTFEPSHHTVWYRKSAQPQQQFKVLIGV